MWLELLAQHELAARDPATEDQLAKAERDLGFALPAELRAFLLETNGAFDQYGFAWIRPAADIVFSSRAMWRLDDEPHYMAFAPHLFFGEEGDGDEYFFRVLGGEADTEIFLWLHEEDNRQSYAYNLSGYLSERTEEARKEFDPEFDFATLDTLLECVAFLDLAGDDVLDPDVAVRQLEEVATRLKRAPDDQRRAFAGRAQGLAAGEPNPQRAEFFRNVATDLDLFP